MNNCWQPNNCMQPTTSLNSGRACRAEETIRVVGIIVNAARGGFMQALAHFLGKRFK